jgi:acetyl-CoA C-acetyltransferase
MKDVYILSCGQIPVAKYPQDNIATLGSRAVIQALNNAQVPAEDVGALYAGNMMSGQLSHQQLVATLIANHSGMTGCEAITAEGACGSGAAAMRLGYQSIASDSHKCVVVCGVEHVTHAPREEITQALATASCWEYEGGQGETFLTLNAHVMQQYMEKYHVGPEVFAPFAINAHNNASKNPRAMLQKKIDTHTYLSSKIISAPIKLYDAPPICDGAAALVLVNKDMALAAKKAGINCVKVTGSAVASDHLRLSNRKDLLTLEGAKQSFLKAYAQSQLTPADIDLFEPHDAYTIMTVLSLEAAGFSDYGCGYQLADEGVIALDGDIPITTFGGLKSRGHPVGATGVYQLAECFEQLTEQAGDNQVANARIAMAQNLGGAGSVAFTHILQQES